MFSPTVLSLSLIHILLAKLKADYQTHLRGLLPSTDYVRFLERKLSEVYRARIVSTEELNQLHKDSTTAIDVYKRQGEGMFGNYLKFETSTLCPICKKGIIKEMLTAEETAWLDNYHQHVYAVSYTHLDVYKRQICTLGCSRFQFIQSRDEFLRIVANLLSAK